MDWRELLGGVGAVTGVVSLSWLILKDALAWGRRPRLVVEAFDPDTDIRSFGATEGRRRRYVHLHVHNDGRMTAKRVVAKLTHVSGPRGESFLDRSYSLHWAGVELGPLDSCAEVIDIGSESRRLDIAFTDESTGQEGCWVAYPLALVRPSPQHGHLPAGEHEVRVDISFDGGKAPAATLRLNSPRQWNDLSAGTP